MRIVLGALVVGMFASCGESSPCATCPPVQGTYAMAYEAVTIASPDCATLPAPAGPASVAITRGGAELRATIYGLSGRGVMQDTGDFSISATQESNAGRDGGTQSYVLRGYYLATRVGADAGSGSIFGKWVTHGEAGAKICDAERPFTGTKQ